MHIVYTHRTVHMYLSRVEAAVHNEFRGSGAVKISLIDTQRIQLGHVVTCVRRNKK